MKDIKKLMSKYFDFLNSNFDIEKIEKNIYKITTPFLDRRNDHITVYAIINNDKIKLTDDSYTIDDLELEGIKFEGKREEELKTILNGYGIYKENNELFVITDENSFPRRKHNFLQALININDMYLLASPRVSSIFLDDIKEYFDEKELIYTQNISIEGKSKISHKFDFLIPRQIRKNKTEALIKAINHPKLENIRAYLFSFEDIRNVGRNEDGFFILNDKNKINEKIYDALKEYNVTPIHWTKIENEFNKLSVVA